MRCCRGFGGLAGALDGTTVQHLPLEGLHADAASEVREYDHVVVLAELGNDRRAWQAWVRLTKVFRIEKVAILNP